VHARLATEQSRVLPVMEGFIDKYTFIAPDLRAERLLLSSIREKTFIGVQMSE
jgi:hypothetical protein